MTIPDWGIWVIAFAHSVALTALLIAMPHIRPKQKCPACGRRGMEWVDAGVLYDPAPSRNLLRCNKCQAEFVVTGQGMVPRADWDDPEDQELWDSLNKHEKPSLK
jgi:hypothetical protein